MALENIASLLRSPEARLVTARRSSQPERECSAATLMDIA